MRYNSIDKRERDFPSNGYIKLEGTKWKKLRGLGKGGCGTVYEVITNHEAHCAVKVVRLSDHKGQSQLQREIQMYSQYEHENIVRYLGAYEDSEKLYVFLELMPNGSLETVYKKRSLTDSEVSTITRQILNGLEFLHGKNVIHRDIKCANILVGECGSVKVADFGVAKDTNMDAAKSSVGTPLYMAPEVVKSRNEDRYGSAADIWSLGCTVLEMLTRKRPYPCSNPLQVLWKVMNGEVPDVPEELPRKARDFILRCLKVNPSDRPTAAQLLRDPFVD